MIQLVVGAAAGYLMGTKAGRRRYEQIRRGYETAVNSDVTKAAVRAGRKTRGVCCKVCASLNF